MGKYLLFGVIAFLFWKFISKFFAKEDSINNPRNKDKNLTEMVKCEKCGTYIEKSSATYSSSKWKCAEKCG